MNNRAPIGLNPALSIEVKRELQRLDLRNQQAQAMAEQADKAAKAATAKKVASKIEQLNMLRRF